MDQFAGPLPLSTLRPLWSVPLSEHQTHSVTSSHSFGFHSFDKNK